ncbi:triose-phosphate transporter family-domain-containing protein [Hypoxylon argillaceum]|nr:triose-phosphate transporter family-domain-containing protein [Hypoxylon argillaceum]
MTKKRYMRAVVPIAVFYSGSLVCSNLVYLYMSLAFIQIVKNAAPFTTLIIAWLWGLEQPAGTTILKVLIIVFGIGLASVGDIHFSWVGLLYSCGGLLFESIRVVLVQELLQGNGVNMDPLVGLYYYAPISAATNLFIAWATEWPSFHGSAVAQVGVTMLALNAFIAFFLNVASMMVIGKTSGLVLHLTGVLKNILLVVTAALIWSTPITSVQILGYSISLIGFVLYKLK